MGDYGGLQGELSMGSRVRRRGDGRGGGGGFFISRKKGSPPPASRRSSKGLNTLKARGKKKKGGARLLRTVPTSISKKREASYFCVEWGVHLLDGLGRDNANKDISPRTEKIVFGKLHCTVRKKEDKHPPGEILFYEKEESSVGGGHLSSVRSLTGDAKEGIRYREGLLHFSGGPYG